MRTKKLILVVFCFLFLGMVSGAFAKEGGGLELLVPGELSVATEGTYPPFSMVDEDGKLVGLEISVVQEICKRLGLTYKPVIIKWESLLIGLFADKYDMTSDGMDITPERQKSVVFAMGWLESGGAVIVRDKSPIERLTDIKGKTVGCLVASTWADLAQNLDPKEVKLYKSESDAIQDLVNGNVDSVVTDAVAGAYAIKATGLPLRMLDQKVSYLQKGFSFKPGKPNLVRAVNDALRDMVADGTYEKLVRDIVGVNTWPVNPIDTIYLEAK